MNFYGFFIEKKNKKITKFRKIVGSIIDFSYFSKKCLLSHEKLSNIKKIAKNSYKYFYYLILQIFLWIYRKFFKKSQILRMYKFVYHFF